MSFCISMYIHTQEKIENAESGELPSPLPPSYILSTGASASPSNFKAQQDAPQRLKALRGSAVPTLPRCFSGCDAETRDDKPTEMYIHV